MRGPYLVAQVRPAIWTSKLNAAFAAEGTR